MSQENSEYLLGTSDQELERLGYQHQLWADETVQLWKSAGFQYGHAIADLGCGPGFATSDLSGLVGNDGRVFAIEYSRTYLDLLNQRLAGSGFNNISVHECDVHTIDLPNESADGVFARWLLCFVQDPAKVVHEAMRILKPGGSLVVMDYFNYTAVKIFPSRESFPSLFQGYYDSVKKAGGSYDIGNDLPEMLSSSGFEVEELKPICRTGRPGSALWKWVELFNSSFIPKLVDKGIWDEAQRDRFETDWEIASRDPATFFFAPPILGVVAKKPL